MSDPVIVRRGHRPDPALHDQWRQRFACFDSYDLTAAVFWWGVELPSNGWCWHLDGSITHLHVGRSHGSATFIFPHFHFGSVGFAVSDAGLGLI
jgi:hypothetical protein